MAGPNGRAHPDAAVQTLTHASPHPPGLSSVLERNIQALKERQQREEHEASAQERVADRITRFTGSMLFVYIHLVLFGFWIVANLGWIPGIPRWDPTFVVLAMWASVEAIFLSTFVLISQNRMSAVAERRSELDLQISLLAEHEITRLTTLVASIAERLDVQTRVEDELTEIQEDVSPEAVLDAIEATDETRKVG
ncbi:DUF1003 domain-containing protein [Rubellimicrobium arenae]|uniref:DUF1003 domain-containing protein n=1 Tax=Rubellimicrobium arenae TaxID=2817372 RepID=UPI001B30AAE0|nr:DUF1003 domain-containing protein [Rubellimicrobium arenae]